MKSAVIYARYSCERQTEQSIEGQLRVCQKYAQDNNLIILNTYIDRAMTGTNDHRPAFQQMLHDCEKGVPWDIVLVYAIDRFGRNSIEIAVNKQKLQKNNKTLISATQRTSENIDGTKNLDGILLENMYIGLAEYYSAELSQKIKRGLRENREKGLFRGGFVPYGYCVIDKKLTILPDEAQIIKFIYDLYLQGYIVTDIIKILNNKGLLIHGKPFYYDIVHRTLTYKPYTGIYKFGDKIYTNIYPPIISLETFEEVQSLMKYNHLGMKATNNPYLLRKLIKCGYCGENVNGDSGTSKTTKLYRYYKCSGRKHKEKDCPLVTFRQQPLEKLVIDVTEAIFNNPKNIQAFAKKIIESYNDRIKNTSFLNTLEKEKKEKRLALDNVMKAVELGVITETTRNRLTELELQLKQIEEQIELEKYKSNNELKIKDVEEDIKKFIRLHPERMLHYLIQNIIIYNDKIKILYKYTVKNTPQNDEGCFHIKPNSAEKPSFVRFQVPSFLLKYLRSQSLCKNLRRKHIKRLSKKSSTAWVLVE